MTNVASRGSGTGMGDMWRNEDLAVDVERDDIAYCAEIEFVCKCTGNPV